MIWRVEENLTTDIEFCEINRKLYTFIKSNESIKMNDENPSPDGASNAMEAESMVYIYGISGTDELTLELLFESEKKTGGGEISQIEIRRDENLAVVTFKDKQVAERVLSRCQVSFNGTVLHMKPPPKMDPYSIIVRGLPPTCNEMILEMFFESTKKSSGGDVSNIEYTPGADMAVVTFQEADVAKRVLQRTALSLGGVTLSVRSCPAPTRIQVLEVTQGDLLNLELYFETRGGGGDVKSCTIQNGVALIKFADPEVVPSVLRKDHKLGERPLVVKAYHAVCDPPDDITPPIEPCVHEMVKVWDVSIDELFTFELYFDTPERSGGGDVESCTLQNGAAIIKFKDPGVIPKVLEREHKLLDKTWRVEPYDPANIEPDPNQPENDQDTEIWIETEHPEACEFLKRTSDGKAWERDRGAQCNFEIDWSKSTSDKMCVKLANSSSSSPTEGATNREWKLACRGDFDDFFKDLEMQELQLNEEQMVIAENRIQELEKSAEPAVLVSSDQSQKTIRFFGFSHQAIEAKTTLERHIEEAQQKKKIIEHEIPLGRGKLELFKRLHCEKDLKSRVPDLEVDYSSYSLVLRGCENNIQLGTSILYDIFLDSVVTDDIPLNGSKYSLMKHIQVTDLIEHLIGQNNLMATLEVDNSTNTVTICGLTAQDIAEVKKLIDDNIVERTLQFSGSGTDVLISSRWDMTKRDLETKHKDCLVVQENRSGKEARIFCTSDVLVSVDTTVAGLEDLASDEVIVAMALPTATLLQRFHTDKLNEIQASVKQSCSGCSITISVSDPEMVPGFIIKGPKDAVAMAKSHLTSLYTRVMRDDHEERTPSMPLFYMSRQGEQFLMSLERQNRAICIVDDKMDRLLSQAADGATTTGGASHTDGASAAGENSPPAGATAASEPALLGATAAAFPTSNVICLEGGKKITISSEDLKTSDVDAVVIPATDRLQHELPSVRDLVSFGGSEIQEACKDQANLRGIGKLNETTSCITMAGQLRCKRVIHVVANKGDLMQMADSFLQEGVSASFEDIKYQEDIRSTAIFICEAGTFDRKHSDGKTACIARAVLGFLAFDFDHDIKEITLVALDPDIQDLLKKNLHEIIKDLGLSAVENDPDDLDGSSSGSGLDPGGVSGVHTCPDTAEDSETPEEDAIDASDVPKSVVLSVYALEPRDVTQVIKAIKSKADDLCSTEKLNDQDVQELIRQMSPDQAQQVLELHNYFSPWLSVDIRTEDNLNYIEICGRQLKVAKCEAKVKDILSGVTQTDNTDNSSRTVNGDVGGAVGGAVGAAAAMQQADENYADAMAAAEMFCWEVKLDTGNFTPLPRDISALLEIAYKDQQVMAEYVDEDEGSHYRVNFRNMKMERLDGDRKVTSVRRKGEGLNVVDNTNTISGLPVIWTAMGTHDRLKVEELDKNNQEYRDVESGFKQTCSNLHIRKIERIQNPALYRQYQVRKQHILVTNNLGDENEQLLYHGTSGDTVPKINVNGFNRSYCGKNATMFGQGVYFAKEARYSARAQYSPQDQSNNRYMYQCLVLTGETTKGHPDYVEPPPKQPQNQTVRFDSVVDHENQPGIYVIFHDAQAYPEYLITFS